jgi:serine/threonine-protein kinase
MSQTAKPTSLTQALVAALSTPDMSGRILNDFRLLRRLGQGGMGQVYLAEQISLKRPVAIKVMRSELAITPESFQRFRAEAEAIARLSHPNIVQVYAFGEEAGLHYMALEYVAGRNLGQYLAKKGTVDLPVAISIVRQTAAALQRVSEVGIIHRDIKPENLLLTRRGEVKVADFGLSRCFGTERPAPNLTQSGMTVGTPLYMSPEQVQGLAVDPRTDIYSLGVTAYHMLAGQPPFKGHTAFELAMQHVRQSPVALSSVRPDLPPRLCATVHKMMAKEPDKRYPSCTDLLKELAQIREGLAGGKGATRLTIDLGSLRSLPALVRLALPRSRRSRLVWATSSMILALCFGAALALKTARSRQQPIEVPKEAAALAEAEKEKFLKEAVAQYADPADNQSLSFRRDLGLLYLHEDRLSDAADFFNDLAGSSVKSFQFLGRLGQAIVLARQDHPEQSNQMFVQLVKERRPPTGQNEWFAVLFNQPQLRYEIARALDRNKLSLSGSQPWPAELERLRQAPKRLENSGDLLRQSGLEKILNKDRN